MKHNKVIILTAILIPFIFSLMTNIQPHSSSARSMAWIEDNSKTGYGSDNKTFASVSSVELFPYDDVDVFPNNLHFSLDAMTGILTDTVNQSWIINADAGATAGWSTDSKTLSFGDGIKVCLSSHDLGNLIIFDADTQTIRRLCYPFYISNLAWSPFVPDRLVVNNQLLIDTNTETSTTISKSSDLQPSLLPTLVGKGQYLWDPITEMPVATLELDKLALNKLITHSVFKICPLVVTNNNQCLTFLDTLAYANVDVYGGILHNHWLLWGGHVSPSGLPYSLGPYGERSDTIIYLTNLITQETQELYDFSSAAIDDAFVTGLGWSPDGNTIALALTSKDRSKDDMLLGSDAQGNPTYRAGTLLLHLNWSTAGEVTLPWKLPQIPCVAPDHCNVFSQVDQNGVLYANWVDQKQLFIVHPDGSQATKVDLASIIDSLPAGRFEDFVPFEDGTMVFEGPPIISGTASRNYNLYFYNPENNQAMRLSELFPGGLTVCDPSLYVQNHGFYRIGNKDSKKIIACSRDSDGIYNINVLDLNSMSVEETVPTRKGFSESDLRPWIKLQGGNDGNLYIQLYSGASEMPFLKDVMTDIPHAYTYVVRRTPGTTHWSIIPVPELIFSNLPAVSNLESLTLVGVDELGNLYFSILWTDAHTLHTEFVKLSPAGKVIWHVSEDNLGELGYFVDLIYEDRFVTQAGDISHLKLIQIDGRHLGG